MKTIEIIVYADGTTKVETKGFQGVECQQASQRLEASLGNVVSDRPTAERYEQPVQNSREQEGAG